VAVVAAPLLLLLPPLGEDPPHASRAPLSGTRAAVASAPLSSVRRSKGALSRLIVRCLS